MFELEQETILYADNTLFVLASSAFMFQRSRLLINNSATKIEIKMSYSL